MPLEPLSIVEIALLADLYAGDFDGNQIVDAADMDRWQGDFGSGGAGGDADGDGDTDGADFLVWQTQFMGDFQGGLRQAPEPTAATLAVVLLAVYFAVHPEKA